MIVQFVNQQNKYKPQIWRDLLSQMMSLTLDNVPWARKLPGQTAEPSMTIYLVGPRTIRRVNRQTRSIDAVTDVLSFPLLDMHDGKPVAKLSDQDFEHLDDGRRLLPLGDIIICLDQAFTQAEQFGQSAEREIAFLAMHGLLHLLGYDHDTPEREKSMRRKQRQVLKRAAQREVLELAQ
jgi:probable rRNA maturation factor